jgi:hypothetical protein
MSGVDMYTADMKTEGQVYALTNPAMPGLIKIGFTDGDVYARARELSRSTGVPEPFEVLRAVTCTNPRLVEAKLHELFSEYRVVGREFFRISQTQVINAFRLIVECNGTFTAERAGPPNVKYAKSTPRQGASGAGPQREPDTPRFTDIYAEQHRAALKGNMPSPPDFSAKTQTGYRGKLTKVIELAKKRAFERLKAFHIYSVSTSPKAIKRYPNAIDANAKNTDRADNESPRYTGIYAEQYQAALRGKMPSPPDFSANTHARYRGKLAKVIELAERRDLEGLKAFHVNPVSTSPKAIKRYRDLCIIALSNVMNANETPRYVGIYAEQYEAALKGKMPSPPDFSAETHRAYRRHLAEVVAMAEKRDLKGLQSYSMTPESSSRRAICRYRDICITALEAPSKGWVDLSETQR